MSDNFQSKNAGVKFSEEMTTGGGGKTQNIRPYTANPSPKKFGKTNRIRAIGGSSKHSNLNVSIGNTENDNNSNFNGKKAAAVNLLRHITQKNEQSRPKSSAVVGGAFKKGGNHKNFPNSNGTVTSTNAIES
jgi:hypothetical protein